MMGGMHGNFSPMAAGQMPGGPAAMGAGAFTPGMGGYGGPGTMMGMQGMGIMQGPGMGPPMGPGGGMMGHMVDEFGAPPPPGMMGGGPGMMPGAGMMGPPPPVGMDYSQAGFGPEYGPSGQLDMGPPGDFPAPPPPPGQPQGFPDAPGQDIPAVPERPSKRQYNRGNDYCQHFVDTGARPQNFLRDSLIEDRYQDYPQLKRLIQLKDQQVANYRTPMYGLRADLRKLKLSKELFGTKFDVILIDPPWEEYIRRAPHFVEPGAESWTWEEIRNLNIEDVADTPSFVFLWCGSAEGLDAARHCFQKWGFKRIEDICWIKSNKDVGKRKYLSAVNQEPGSMLVHTKEHCLIGMRGTLKRSLDAHIFHCNVDTDVIVSEEPPLGSTEKPKELYEIIERFCNGRRRLELFGEDHNLWEGWVTVGKSISQTTFKKQAYLNHFRTGDGVIYDEHRGGKPPPGSVVLVPSSDEIEQLRPRSPPPSRGRGRGRG
eukprot:GHUV01022599.1.p1 GENE.GHUV01022599.1~~GHUV01022599.1.p1  ORF type:complete len:485 (+),score=113.06 GHUV01022599.1:720-2174(+)